MTTLPRPDFSSRSFAEHGAEQARSLEGLPLASFRRRAAALALDLLFVTLAWLPLALLLAILMAKGTFGPAPERDIVLAANRGPGKWVFLPLSIAYFVLSTWLWDGRTPGKRLLRIRVRSLHHPGITAWTALERCLGYGASMLEFGFGFLQYYLHPNRQTVHDRIAETIVVREPHGSGGGPAEPPEA